MTKFWENMFHSILVWTTNNSGIVQTEYNFKSLPIYPMCQLIDLATFFDFHSYSVHEVLFKFNVVADTGLALFIEEKNREVTRALKALQDSYTGQLLSNEDLGKPKDIKVSLKVTQTKHSDRDSGYPCVNYPSEEFESFGMCDNQLTKNHILDKTGLLPFWVTGSLNETTELRY